MADPTPQESWRPVKGYEDRYEVSDQGQVRSLWEGRGPRKAPKVLRTSSGGHNGGYRHVTLCDGRGGKHTTYVAPLVLRTFVGPPASGQEASHQNGKPTDNRLSNLAWASRVENEAMKRVHGTALSGERHPKARLSRSDVVEMRVEREAGATLKALSDRYRVSETTVSDVCRRRRWAHV